jgi:hypothetical protein
MLTMVWIKEAIEGVKKWMSKNIGNLAASPRFGYQIVSLFKRE